MPLFMHAHTGLGLVGYQPVNGLPNAWRMVVTGDVDNMDARTIDELVSNMVQLATDL